MQSDANKKYNSNIDILFRDIKSIPPLSPKEEEELISIYYKTSDEVAKQRLIEANLRLVLSIAIQFSNEELEVLDLFQEGCLGLIRGIEKFNPNLGYKLTTYIHKSISMKIIEYISRKSKLIRTPRTEEYFKYKKSKDKLLEIYGTNLSLNDIANYLKLPYSVVFSYESYSMRPTSLNETIDEREQNELLDIIEDNRCENPQDVVVDSIFCKDLKNDISDTLSKLPEKTRLYIELMYGLYDGKIRTLEETAEELYRLKINDKIIKRQGVDNVIKRGFEKLERSPKLKKYKEFL